MATEAVKEVMAHAEVRATAMTKWKCESLTAAVLAVVLWAIVMTKKSGKCRNADAAIQEAVICKTYEGGATHPHTILQI